METRFSNSGQVIQTIDFKILFNKHTNASSDFGFSVESVNVESSKLYLQYLCNFIYLCNLCNLCNFVCNLSYIYVILTCGNGALDACQTNLAHVINKYKGANKKLQLSSFYIHIVNNNSRNVTTRIIISKHLFRKLRFPLPPPPPLNI